MCWHLAATCSRASSGRALTPASCCCLLLSVAVGWCLAMCAALGKRPQGSGVSRIFSSVGYVVVCLILKREVICVGVGTTCLGITNDTHA